MYKNYLLVFFRNLARHKTISLINIIGLTIGMTSCFLILIYVAFEFSYEKQHDQVENIYRIRLDLFEDGRRFIELPKCAPALGPALVRDVPGVKEFTRLLPLAFHRPVVLSYTNNDNQQVSFQEHKIYTADPAFSKIFTFPMIRGDLQEGLNDPNSLLISEVTAKRYFGDNDPIGKIVEMLYGYPTKLNFTVRGVFKEVPQNSHLKIDFLISNKVLYSLWGEGPNNVEDNWESALFYTYILLSPEIHPERVQAQFPDLIARYQTTSARGSKKIEYSLQPLSQIHLQSKLAQEAEDNGNRNQVYLLTIVAVFILIIAWINYSNLYTAWAIERAREVGIRKAVGASYIQLIKQFLLESLLLNIIALLITLATVLILLPFFRQLTNKPLYLDVLSPSAIMIFTLLFIAGFVASSLYPAFILSSFRPLSVIKGKIKSFSSGEGLRKALLVLQYAVSVALIIGTFIVLRQMNYVGRHDVGVNMENMIVVKGPIPDSSYLEKITSFKTELLKEPNITNVTASSIVPGKSFVGHTGARIKGRAKDEGSGVFKVWIDYDFMSTFDMNILAGRAFSEEFGSENESLIINESAAKQFGFTNPLEALNEVIVGLPEEGRIVGVVKDHYHNSLKNNPDPMVFMVTKRVFGYNTIKLKINDNSLQQVKVKWEELFPESPFNYFYLTDFFKAQYRNEVQFGKAFAIFAALAILIACLGLFGLSAFNTKLRSKEIGIRTILGASVGNILLLFSRGYIKLVLLANLIAWPVIYMVMDNWLSKFAVKAPVEWLHFITAGLIVMGLALLTVGYNVISVTSINAVKLLRED